MEREKWRDMPARGAQNGRIALGFTRLYFSQIIFKHHYFTIKRDEFLSN